ncbi:T9SS type A sorting domain-containing protein [Flavobacterium sp. J27]|uniref:T9SS type A sorting domain-containing protein n=1 Tax=Flavobacterium sp. J27 TaxID=2060419 RepID=UPI001030940D|nr:T9SS type A sorting domain-containing protein [Flavobacterium sp. J27]
MTKQYTFLFLFFVVSSIGQVVEPVLQWAGNIGSQNSDVSAEIVSDSEGNVYFTGAFYGTANFDIGGGVHTMSNTHRSAFMVKYDGDGEIVWSGQYTTNYLDCYATGLGIDNNNNLYATGRFFGTVDFDFGPGVHYMSANTTPPAQMNIYLTKLNTDGGFLWARQIQGIGTKTIEAFTVDAMGNSYITGCFNNPMTFHDGTVLTPQNPIWTGESYDIFIAKYDTEGNLLFAKQIGSGPYTQRPTAIKIDAQGNIYTGGIFVNTTDFDPGLSEFIIAPQTPNYIASFLLKLDSNGNFVWVKNFGSTSHLEFSSLLVDTSNAIYVSGGFMGTTDFNSGSGVNTLTTTLGGEFFLLKLDANGEFVWVKGMKAIGRGMEIIETENHTILISGKFVGTCDFSGGNNTALFSSHSTANSDVFLAKYDLNGDLNWLKTFGGNDYIKMTSLDYNTSGAVHLIGSFQGSFDFGTTTDTFSTTSYGITDCFVMKFDQNTLGTEEFEVSNSELMIYPNPSINAIHLAFPDTFEQGKYKIFSINGQLVMQNELQKNINISSLSSGFYFITIFKDDNSITAKFLKE